MVLHNSVKSTERLVFLEEDVENAKVDQSFNEKQKKEKEKKEKASVRSKHRARNSFRPGTKG